MSELSAVIDKYNEDKRSIARMYLLATAAKAIAVVDAAAAAEDGSAAMLPDVGPLAGLYLPGGARIIKRSRKGKTRRISLRIAVNDKGTLLYWPSVYPWKKKKFYLTTLYEVAQQPETPEASNGSIVLRLRNEKRSLDIVAESAEDCATFSTFFNGFRR